MRICSRSVRVEDREWVRGQGRGKGIRMKKTRENIRRKQDKQKEK